MCKMAHIEKTVLVEHPSERMFALVDHVEDYPQFLPWCSGSSVEYRDDRITRATINIDYHHVRTSFGTENTRTQGERIELRLLHGPFRQLEGRWTFTPLGKDACKIELRLTYEFSSRLLEKLVGPVFSHIAGSLVDAFIKRAERLHAAR